MQGAFWNQQLHRGAKQLYEHVLYEGSGGVSLPCVIPSYRPVRDSRTVSVTGVPAVSNWEGPRERRRGTTGSVLAGPSRSVLPPAPVEPCSELVIGGLWWFTEGIIKMETLFLQ